MPNLHWFLIWVWHHPLLRGWFKLVSAPTYIFRHLFIFTNIGAVPYFSLPEFWFKFCSLISGVSLCNVIQTCHLCICIRSPHTLQNPLRSWEMIVIEIWCISKKPEFLCHREKRKVKKIAKACICWALCKRWDAQYRINFVKIFKMSCNESFMNNPWIQTFFPPK